MSEEEDHAYSTICLAMAQKRTGVRFQGPENLNIKKVMTAVVFDQPMLFYIKREYTCQYSYQEGAFTIGWSFQMPQDEINTYIGRVDRRIKYLKMNDRGNQIERELFIHNTLLGMGLRTGPNDWKDHCIIGPLLEGRTVCEGVALLFLLLCAMCRIHCIYVSGFAGNLTGKEAHAWNIVRLNNSWAHVDAYWDIILASHNNKTYNYNYFNVSDDYIRHDHDWCLDNYPLCFGFQANRQVFL